MEKSSAKYVMGIDNGGSLIKCALFSLDGIQIASASERVPLDKLGQGMTQRDGAAVWKANCMTIRRTVEAAGINPSNIAGISVCGYGGGLCLLGDEGELIHPLVVSTDIRAESIVQDCQRNGIDELIAKRTGQRIWAGQQIALLAWFHEYAKQVLDRAKSALSIKDFIRYKLTGDLFSDYTDASNNGLIYVETTQLDREVLRLMGIDDYSHLFPQLRYPHEHAGRITEGAAKETGLVPGTPVAAGLYDVSACCAACGAMDDSILCLVTGTWSINAYLSSHMQSNCNSMLSFLSGYYLVEEASPTSASNLDWFLEHFYKDQLSTQGRKELYQHCNEKIAVMDPAQSNIVYVPYLYASNTTPNAKGAFFNVQSHHGRDHMLLGMYEGILFSSCTHIERLVNSLQTDKQVRLSGGVANSPVWTQMFADILQTPIQVMEGNERGALGAAICAGINSGCFADFAQATERMVTVAKEYTPNKNRSDIYRTKYQAYKKALQALALFHQ